MENYDESWKEAIETFFPQFLAFFFPQEIIRQEEEKTMPYITTAERIGMRKGMEQGLQQGLLEDARGMLLEALEERFGKVPLGLAEQGFNLFPTGSF